MSYPLSDWCSRAWSVAGPGANTCGASGRSAHGRCRGARKKGASPQHSINTQTHPDAAGIDVGAEVFVVAVPPDRWEDPVRTYASFTSGVHALRDWLLDCGIKTAAMESTGNYWVALYAVLTQAGIDAILVGGRDPKKLAALRDKRCRSSAEDIIKALRGDYREE